MTRMRHAIHTALAILAVIVQQPSGCNGFSTSSLSSSSPVHVHHHSHALHQRAKLGGHDDVTSYATSSLKMGLFDFAREKFMGSREGDFIPLEKSDGDTFGPGPLILMYAVPNSMEDDELMDMAEDGMPQRKGVTIQRIEGMDENGEGGGDLLDLSVGNALEKAIDSKSAGTTSSASADNSISKIRPIVVSYATEGATTTTATPCPVLYFSGVSNAEMMDTYNIMANEIYEETNGVHWPACAKVVPPAMDKSMRRVLLEISGDHADAMRMRREEAEKQKAAE